MRVRLDFWRLVPVRLAILCSLGLANIAWAAAVSSAVAIASPGLVETTVSAERLRDILLGRVTNWSDGTPIIIILSEEPAALAAQRVITGRDLPQLLRGWKRLVYGGNGAMPIVHASSAEVLSEVRRRHGAVTMLPSTVDDERCLVIYRLP